MVNHALLQLPWVAFGFGGLKSKFWLGLDKIHRLTSESNNMLRADLEDFEENTAYADYNAFDINSESDKYRLIRDSFLYNKLSYARVLIGSHLWSIGGQTYGWRHH